MKTFPAPRFSLSKTSQESYSDGQKSPKISISKLHKKFYPLNFTLTSSSFEVPESPRKKYTKCPEFMNEFMSVSPKNIKNVASKIDTRKTYTCRFSYGEDQDEILSRDLHPPISVDIPPVSYQDIKLSRPFSKSQIHKDEMFHPNTVYFSQRSKMVLYSRSPMKWLPPQNKKLNFVKTPAKPQFNKIMTHKDYDSFQKPRNFDEKLKRLREIIKDPLI